MRHLDLFSGIGGFALAAQWMGWETVAFCEREKYARRVLEQHWPNVPIIDDITQWPSERIGCDIITGGFPCQPFSSAGLKQGQKDDRYLWPAMLSVIEQERPAWVVGENVFGIIKMALDQVLSDLEAIGYATRAFVVPACAVDAQHRRDRVWIVGHSNSKSQPNGAIHEKASIMRHVDDTHGSGWGQKCKEMAGKQAKLSKFASVKSNSLADSSSIQRQRMRQKSVLGEQDIQRQFGRTSEDQPNRWPIEPPVGRVANGIPNRLAKLRGLGNAIVPQVAHQIFQFIEQHERTH
jgi:DNA (cytosine-5)-methyltransferase 1